MASKETAVKASNTHESTVTPAGSTVQVHEESGMPVMLVQAIIIAATLCVCELVCSPIYLSFTPGLFPIGSWVLVAMLLAVAFTYVVGFALLWCAESFAYRMKRKLQPVVYSLIGAVGFAVWTIWVVLGFMNMIAGPVLGQTVSHHDTIVAGVNGAILGFASFFFASTLGERLAKYTKVTIVIGVVTVLLAIAGGFLFAAMYQSVHA